MQQAECHAPATCLRTLLNSAVDCTSCTAEPAAGEATAKPVRAWLHALLIEQVCISARVQLAPDAYPRIPELQAVRQLLLASKAAAHVLGKLCLTADAAADNMMQGDDSGSPRNRVT